MTYCLGRVSILIPLYNRAKYIDKTLESAFSQEYTDFEVIVVDDGSSDGGDKIVQAYADAGKLQLYRHPHHANLGQSVSLNLALKYAQGEFIVILDSDDIILPNKLSSQVSFLNAHTDIGLVYGMGVAIDANGHELYPILSESHRELNDPNRILLDPYFHLPVGSLVRRSVYDKVGGFDTSLRAGQDHDMMIRMAENTRFAFAPEKVYCYRRHGESISANGLEARWRHALTILNRAASRYPYKKSILRKRKAVINFRLSQALFTAKKSLGEAIARLFLSFVYDPVRACRVLLHIEKIS